MNDIYLDLLQNIWEADVNAKAANHNVRQLGKTPEGSETFIQLLQNTPMVPKRPSLFPLVDSFGYVENLKRMYIDAWTRISLETVNFDFSEFQSRVDFLNPRTVLHLANYWFILARRFINLGLLDHIEKIPQLSDLNCLYRKEIYDKLYMIRCELIVFLTGEVEQSMFNALKTIPEASFLIDCLKLYSPEANVYLRANVEGGLKLSIRYLLFDDPFEINSVELAKLFLVKLADLADDSYWTSYLNGYGQTIGTLLDKKFYRCVLREKLEICRRYVNLEKWVRPALLTLCDT